MPGCTLLSTRTAAPFLSLKTPEVTTSEPAGRPETIETWDSLAQVRLVHELETAFGVRLPDSALLEPQDVASLRDMVVAQAAPV